MDLTKMADVNRGILLPVKFAAPSSAFTQSVDVSDPDGISRTTLENTIKETIRQIGARIMGETLQ